MPSRIHRTRSDRGVGAGDRGSATLEGAVLLPVLLLVIFTAVQLALWFYGRNLALAAAQEGVRAARVQHSVAAAGVSAARGFLDRAGGDSLAAVSVSSAGSGTTEVRIRVTARSVSVLPGIPGMPISQSAHGTRERFTTPGSP